MGGSMGYLSAPNGVPEYPYETPTSSHFALWKPASSYFPRGEAPPPYEEAVAAAHAEAMANVTNNSSSHRTIPLNIATSASFRLDANISNPQSLPITANISTSTTNNSNNNHVHRERSNTTVPSNHRQSYSTAQVSIIQNTTPAVISHPPPNPPPQTQNMSTQVNAPVVRSIQSSTKQANTTSVGTATNSLQVNVSTSSTSTQSTSTLISNPISSIMLSQKKNKSILSHLEQCEACSQQASALENEGSVALDLNKTHSVQDLAAVLPPPLFDVQEIKRTSTSTRHRTIPRHLTMGALDETLPHSSLNCPPPSPQVPAQSPSYHSKPLSLPHSSSNSKQSSSPKSKPLPLSLPSTSLNQIKTKPMPLSLPPSSPGYPTSSSRVYSNKTTPITPPSSFTPPPPLQASTPKTTANTPTHGLSKSSNVSSRNSINTPPPILPAPLSLSIPPNLSTTPSMTTPLDDGDDYRSECENCKSAHGSRYYLQEEEELGSPHETMTLQRKPLEGNEDETYYRTSLTLPTNTKKNRNTPLHAPCSARESWFSSMPSTSSSDDE